MTLRSQRGHTAGRCLLLQQMRERGFSGGQIHALAVQTMLRKLGWSAEILTPFSGRGLLRKPVFAMRYGLEKVNRQSGIFWLRWGHDLYLRAALRRELRGSAPAVLYAQDPLSARTALAVRRPGLDKVVLVVHFNDSQALEWAARGEVPAGGWMFRRMQALEQSILPKVDALVYVSAYMKRRIEERIPGAAAVPSAVIPNFVEPPSPSPEARAGDILSIGTLEPRKNQAHTLRVLAELHRRGLKLTATFLGGGEDRAALEQLTRELRLTQFVHFAGNTADAAGWLHTHRVLVHAALIENCPVTLIEALACGTPIVAGAVGGIPELADKDTGAVWTLWSVERDADRLQSLLTDNARMRSAGAEARARHRTRFTPEIAGSALASLFAGVLGEESAGRVHTGAGAAALRPRAST